MDAHSYYLQKFALNTTHCSWPVGADSRYRGISVGISVNDIASRAGNPGEQQRRRRSATFDEIGTA
jgi:hypothetical protein